MNNELQQHKTADTVKWILTLVAFILVGIMLIGIILGWFEKKELQGEQKEEAAQTSQSLIVGESVGHNMSLASFRSAVPFAQALESVTLTATVKPDNTAENTGVDWNAKWKNSSSAWAIGENVSDYVTVTPSGDGYAESKIATLNNLQPFGEQIVVTATARDNPEVTASCNVDFVQKVTDFSLSFGTVSCNFGGITNVVVELNANGTPVGGAAKLNKTVSAVYSLTDTFTISYSLIPVDTPFLYKDWVGMGDYWLDFGYATEQYDRSDLATVNAKLDRSALLNYNVSQKGLYFGIQYFRDNMGLNGYYRYYRAGGVFSFPMNSSAFDNNFSPSSLIESYTRIKSGGTYSDGSFSYTYSGLALFKLTAKVTGNFSSSEKTTTFAMGGYTNTSTINAMELSNPSVMF